MDNIYDQGGNGWIPDVGQLPPGGSVGLNDPDALAEVIKSGDPELDDAIQDVVAGMLTGGSHDGVEVVYDDATGKVSITVTEAGVGHNYSLTSTEQFGAVGGLGVDSWAQLQDAIDSGKSLYFHAPEFAISQPLDFRNHPGCRYVGTLGRTKIRALYNDKPIFYTGGMTNVVSQYFDGFYLEHNSGNGLTPNDAGVGIKAYNQINSQFKNIEVWYASIGLQCPNETTPYGLNYFFENVLDNFHVREFKVGGIDLNCFGGGNSPNTFVQVYINNIGHVNDKVNYGLRVHQTDVSILKMNIEHFQAVQGAIFADSSRVVANHLHIEGVRPRYNGSTEFGAIFTLEDSTATVLSAHVCGIDLDTAVNPAYYLGRLRRNNIETSLRIDTLEQSLHTGAGSNEGYGVWRYVTVLGGGAYCNLHVGRVNGSPKLAGVGAGLENVGVFSVPERPLSPETVIAGLEAAPANDIGGAIDGAVFAPTRAGPGAPGQSLTKRFENVLYLGDFGPVGGGMDRSTTFNAMLARANQLGEIASGEGKIGVTCVVPDGHHVLPGPLAQRIVKDGIHIKGESRQGACLELGTGKTFIWGNGTNYVKTGSLCDLRLVYGSPPPADAVVITVDRAYDLDFRNLQLANIRTLARLGESDTGQSGTTRFSGLKGDAANISAPLFDLRHGTGFFLEDSEVQVNDAGYPSDRVSLHEAIPGRNFVEIAAGGWDTCHVSNVLTNRFYRAYYIVGQPGFGVGYVRIANCIHDLCADGVLRIVGGGGIVRKVDVVGMHGAATDGHGVWIVGGGITDVTLVNAAMELCGKNAFRVEFGPTRVKMIGCSDGCCNRLSANTGDDRHSVHMDATDWEIIGGHFGADGAPITGVAGWQAHTGLDVTAGCDRYRIIGAEWGGASADVALAAHAAGSHSRQIANCTKMGGGKLSYAGVTSPTVGASPWTWVNLTGMKQTLILYGGTVSSVTVDTVQVAAATGCMIPVSPGQSVIVTYSSAPTARLSTEP